MTDSRELYADEFGTYWVSAESLTANEARRMVEKAAGVADDGYDVSRVEGVAEERDGEPWFTPRVGSGEWFWEVAER